MNGRPWATLLTPPGRSAVATIAVEGPTAITIVEALFVSASGRKLSRMPVGAIAFGCWQSSRGEEIVVNRTERGLEIHCHGGAAASAAILDSLRPHVDVESTQSRWLAAERQGEIERAAVIALTSSVTQPTAARLLAQLHGSLRAELKAVEADLQSARTNSAKDRLIALLNNARFGLHLTRPWHVVLSGPPNVGKSSLINRILGFERAIVFDQPGTTRDVVTSSSPLDGWPVLWSDTAGIRESKDDLEQQGVARAKTAQRQADCLVHVTDVDHPSSVGVKEDVSPSAESDQSIYVVNKIDLAADSQSLPRGFIRVSAKTGQGVAELLAAVAERLTGQAPNDPKAPLLFAEEQVQLAQAARDALQNKNDAQALQAVQTLLR